MEDKLKNQIIIIYTTIVGVIAIVSFCLKYKELIFLPISLFSIGIILLVLLNRQLSIRKIKKGLKAIDKWLGKQPDLIIAFNRSGSIAAGMLAGHYKDIQVLVIDKVKRIKTDFNIDTITFDVGSLVTVHTKQFKNRIILILFFVIERGTTLERGLEYLNKLNIHGEIKVATLYISKRAKKDFPNVYSVYETSCTDRILKNFPWLFKEYQTDK